MSDLRRLQSDASIVGLHHDDSIPPHAIVRDAATELRQLLDKGVAPDDPRCLALLQLANLTRLHILPRSNDDALTAPDLTARAVHIDLSTATMAAVMGLQNASALTGTAVSIASQANSAQRSAAAATRRPFLPSSSSAPAALKLRLLPRLSQAALDALIHLIRTDHSLPMRPKHSPAMVQPPPNHSIHLHEDSNSTADERQQQQQQNDFSASSGRAQKVRTSARQMKIAAQKQKALEEVQNQQQAANLASAAVNTYITPTHTPGPAHVAAKSTDHPLTDGTNPSPLTTNADMITPRRLSVSFADEAQELANNAASLHPSRRTSGASQLQTSSMQANHLHQLPRHQYQSVQQQQQQQHQYQQWHIDQLRRATQQSAVAQQLRSRAQASMAERLPKGVRGPVAVEKGVMNDAVGTPEDVMEAFMHSAQQQHPIPTPKVTRSGGRVTRAAAAASVAGMAASSSAGISAKCTASAIAIAEQMDNHTRIRAVLAERERMIIRMIRQRQAELAAIPLGVTEQTRRKAIIESKKLALLDLQRVIRHRVSAEMKKLYSPSVQEGSHVPQDHLSMLFRRRDPPIYSYLDGYPRVTPFDGVPELPPRPPQTIAQDSIRMAQFDMSRMNALKAQRKQEYIRKLEEHVDKFRRAVIETHNARTRAMRGIERYFTEKKRIEERRRKMERIERLKLLRSNDEQAYLNLLKDTKNDRLLQLVRQTDNYLMQIGAQVEQQRETADRVLGSDAHDKFAEELGEKGEVPIDAMRRRRDLYYTVTHAVQEEVQQPSIMVHGRLKPYQIEGLKWMVSLYNNNLNGILADEMGLGKTIQTISLITYLVEMKKNPGPYLIIVPLSTMGNWIRELNLWAPSLVKIEYRGDKNRRRYIQRTEFNGGNFNVLLTTYEFTVKDQSVLSPLNWQYIIIDEGHRMKNANCKLAMTLGVKYRSRNRLLLTGTPLQNNLTELWALLNFLLPSIFSSSDTFETWFKQPFETTTLGDTADLEEEERLLVINRLHQVLRPFLLRRLKTDVESQLPQKVEHVIHCHMSSWQDVLYNQVRDRIGLATGAHNGVVRSFNNLLMQFKKVCNHPFLFYDSESVEFISPDYLIRASGKFYLLHHMLPKLKLHGHRTLIFSQMTAALDHLEILLSSINIGYLRLDGSTRADERQTLLNRFNAPDSPYFCFLLSTRAGGLGLNLQTADTVIIFDSDWNPMMDLQAQDRAHRIGQKNVVRVYRLISSGSVEVNILEQANRKLQVDAQVIQAGQFNNKSTESDRHNMLKTLLRNQNKEGDENADVPTIEEVNRMISRSDEELDSYIELDDAMKADGRFKPLLTKKEELPDWVLKPNIEHKDEKQLQQELLESHGRGRRKRKTIHDMDMLTEAEWLKVAEGEITAEEAFERRKKRRISRSSKNGEVSKSKSNGGAAGEDENDDYDGDESDEVYNEDSDDKRDEKEEEENDEEDEDFVPDSSSRVKSNAGLKAGKTVETARQEGKGKGSKVDNGGESEQPPVVKANPRKGANPNPINKGPYGGKSVLLRLRVREPTRSSLLQTDDDGERLRKATRDEESPHHVRDHRKDSNRRRSSSGGRGKKRRRGRDFDSFDDYDDDHNRDSYTGVNGKMVANGELDNNHRSGIQHDKNRYGTVDQQQIRNVSNEVRPQLKIKIKNPMKLKHAHDESREKEQNGKRQSSKDGHKSLHGHDDGGGGDGKKRLTIKIPVDVGIAAGAASALKLKKLGSGGNNAGSGGNNAGSGGGGGGKTDSSSSSIQLQSPNNKRSDVTNAADNSSDDHPLLYNNNKQSRVSSPFGEPDERKQKYSIHDDDDDNDNSRKLNGYDAGYAGSGSTVRENGHTATPSTPGMAYYEATGTPPPRPETARPTTNGSSYDNNGSRDGLVTENSKTPAAAQSTDVLGLSMMDDGIRRSGRKRRKRVKGDDFEETIPTKSVKSRVNGVMASVDHGDANSNSRVKLTPTSAGSNSNSTKHSKSSAHIEHDKRTVNVRLRLR